jgi:hypothetical protein
MQDLRIWFFSLVAMPLLATVNEPFRWEYFSGYRNDRLHWHLQTGGSGLLNTSEIYRDVQFWENGLAIKTIHRDLVLFLRGSYSAFGRGGTVFERYANLPFTTDEPLFRFTTVGWAADTSGYFGYAVNLTPDRTYKVIFIPLFGYSAHFERLQGRDGRPDPFQSINAVGASSYTMSSTLPGTLHLTWFGACVGGGFQIESGGVLNFSGGYSYHWLNVRFKTAYENIVSLFDPGLASQQQNTFFFRTKGRGNLGQTGWGQIDFLLSRPWRIGLGAQIHYYSTELQEIALHEVVSTLVPAGGTVESKISQKLKIRWTSLSGWFMVSREF